MTEIYGQLRMLPDPLADEFDKWVAGIAKGAKKSDNWEEYFDYRFNDYAGGVRENFSWDYDPGKKVITYATTVRGMYDNSARTVTRDDLKQLVKEAVHG